MTRMVLAIVITALLARTATARTDTAFTYQGELRDGGTLANGSYALDFSLWDSLAGGVQIGATNVFAAVPVTDGRFTVQLDYGAAAFDNSDRWLQIDVNATPLAPRQPITRAPYSIQTRGIFVDNAGNVGIGTGAPSVPLEVIGAGNGTGVRGEGFVGVLGEGSTWPLGAPTGVKGVSGSVAALGFGVWGLDKAGSSIVNFAPAGVYGESATDAGVLGHSDSGDGVRGESLTGNAGYFQGKVYVDGDATFNGAVYVGGGDGPRVISFMNLADLRAFITNTGSMIFQIDSDNDSTLDAFEFLGTNNIQLLIEDGDEADIKADGTVISNGIDYAEAFRVDQSSIGPGDVVRLVSGQWEFAELATRAYDALGIGVVSTRPAFLAGMSFNQEDAMDPALTAARDAARAAGDDTLARQLTSQMVELVRQAYRPVAMVGRVPCKVDASYGAIRAGDRLTTSPNPGHAMVQAESGPSIGIALEDRLSGQGMIMVFVQPGWHGLQQGDGTSVTKVPNLEFKGANEAINDRVVGLLRSNRELRDRMAELEAVVQTLLAQQRAEAK